MRASSRNMRTNSASSARYGRMRLSTTMRSLRVSFARNSSAIPPTASRLSSRYEPKGIALWGPDVEMEALRQYV